LAAELSRTESLRIKADYTDLEIEPATATEVVEKAELFVQSVERVFSLDESSLGTEYENHNPNHDDKVSDTLATSKIKTKDAYLQPISLEEMRRQARENWLRLRQQNVQSGKAYGREGVKELGAEDGQGHSLDNDLDG
jgi:hypothetical protein